ncbi:hypothetical protein F2P81_016107 [Scophthalmus maximus]|uniref:Uncharacterized protein n=1 Tax=Scophthalmus maximus TaxID=52904 RepID=A0A6A4SMM4_SCOMX|nr:hypothetical protein F2P81_016107 [Scophthalmus maximus]
MSTTGLGAASCYPNSGTDTNLPLVRNVYNSDHAYRSWVFPLISVQHLRRHSFFSLSLFAYYRSESRGAGLTAVHGEEGPADLGEEAVERSFFREVVLLGRALRLAAKVKWVSSLRPGNVPGSPPRVLAYVAFRFVVKVTQGNGRGGATRARLRGRSGRRSCYSDMSGQGGDY